MFDRPEAAGRPINGAARHSASEALANSARTQPAVHQELRNLAQIEDALRDASARLERALDRMAPEGVADPAAKPILRGEAPQAPVLHELKERREQLGGIAERLHQQLGRLETLV